MNKKQLKILLEQGKKLNKKISFYFNHKTITKQTLNEQEIKGHIEKAEHNLNFVKYAIDGKYSDWSVVGCYYAVYHISLALILKKGYFSKNHDATLCILIKEYYKKELTEEDIKLVNEIYLDNEDILFYTESKEEREKASYSTQIVFDDKEIDKLRQKTLLFVRKAQEVLQKL